MGREIKFRCWDKEHNVMHTNNIKVLATLHSRELFPDGYKVYSQFIFMQFTGLLDKKGVEIYEGDIVRCYSEWDEYDPGLRRSEIKEVSWGGEMTNYPAFDLEPADDYIECNGLQYYAAVQPNGEKIEVIGNIYQHPELLR